jgi:hypothetical protein
MKELVLREELPPGDVVVVVRGGEMNSDFVRRTATRSYEEVGVFTVSVFLALDDDAVDELCRSVEDLERYGKVRLSTVGRLRSLGFALLPTLDAPHFDVLLPDLESGTLNRLELGFDPPVPNPARRR